MGVNAEEPKRHQEYTNGRISLGTPKPTSSSLVEACCFLDGRPRLLLRREDEAQPRREDEAPAEVEAMRFDFPLPTAVEDSRMRDRPRVLWCALLFEASWSGVGGSMSSRDTEGTTEQCSVEVVGGVESGEREWGTKTCM